MRAIVTHRGPRGCAQYYSLLKKITPLVTPLYSNAIITNTHVYSICTVSYLLPSSPLWEVSKTENSGKKQDCRSASEAWLAVEAAPAASGKKYSARRFKLVKED